MCVCERSFKILQNGFNILVTSAIKLIGGVLFTLKVLRSDPCEYREQRERVFVVALAKVIHYHT